MAWTHEHSWKLKATPSRVFAALTESAQLTTWFAEHVDIGDHAGESFRFWGRHTLDTPTASQATQRISAWSRDRTLAFTWRIGAVDTDVAIAISAEGDATRLLLHHTVSGALPFPRERELLDDHWRYVFGNLAMHLAGGSGISLPDFLDAQPEVRQTILIDAPRDVVFHTLITPELVTQWFDAKSPVVEPRVGGRYELGWKYQLNGRDVAGGTTRIIEFVENERLVLDWMDWRGDASVTGQTITFQLETVGVQTRVTFVHAGFQRAADIGDYPFGWTYFIDKLKALTEGCA